MGKIFEVYNVQLGSSGEFRASDESAWLLLRETWQDGRLLNVREIARYATQREALEAMIETRGGPTRLRCGRGQTVFDALEEAGVPYTRIGSWHSEPAENEVLVAEVKVHPSDPPIPVFYAYSLPTLPR